MFYKIASVIGLIASIGALVISMNAPTTVSVGGVYSNPVVFTNGVKVQSATSTLDVKSTRPGAATCFEMNYSTSATTSQTASLRLAATSTTLVTGTTTLGSGIVGYVVFATSSCSSL